MKVVRRVTFDAFGWATVATGVVGVFLPILPGVLFLVIGFYFLSVHDERYGTLLRKYLHKYPTLASRLERLDRFVKRTFNVNG